MKTLNAAAAARLEYLRAKVYAEHHPEAYAILVGLGQMKPLAELQKRMEETENALYRPRAKDGE